jgi:phosphinothricin acetyltransferase
MSGGAGGTAPGIVIRDATEGDMAAIQAIYTHHVLHGLASFEEVPPDTAELNRRRGLITGRGLPYRVAERDGTVLGYAYAGPYRTRRGYRFSVENSVYVAPDAARQGVGRMLLADLIEGCRAAGARQMIAIIGDTGNAPSIGLHASLGFTKAGNIRSVGFKFGRWVDTVIMQLALGDGDTTLPED